MELARGLRNQSTNQSPRPLPRIMHLVFGILKIVWIEANDSIMDWAPCTDGYRISRFRRRVVLIERDRDHAVPGNIARQITIPDGNDLLIKDGHFRSGPIGQMSNVDLARHV